MTARIAAPRLRRLIGRPGGGPTPAAERCELCADPVPAGHRHLLDLSTRTLVCVCGACVVLFDRRAAGGGHYRLIPNRRWYVADFDMDDAAWADLRVPVDMAFFFHSTAAGRVVAVYPSPAGPTESLLELRTWARTAAANPVLAGMEHDVEALLVNRARGARDHWLVPIDDCYALVGAIRTRWKGLDGGREVWAEIERFLANLRRRAEVVGRDGAATRDGRQDRTRRDTWQDWSRASASEGPT